MIRCEICQRSPNEAKVLHRVNEKGVTGRWRCEVHPPQAGECCCNYLLGIMCGYHDYVLNGCPVLDAIEGKRKETNGRVC